VRQGAIGQYVHNALAPGLGKIGTLVALESADDKVGLAALGKQLAMHLASKAETKALSADTLDPAIIERERGVLTEQARASGRPEQVIAQMVEGRLRKFYEDVLLLEQTFVIDGESKIRQVLEKAGKENGTPIRITGFVRMALGEGVERAQ
jgi:elongation factor Ts